MIAVFIAACMAAAAALGFAVLYVMWLSPSLVLRRLRRNGIDGPEPDFPYGNLREMYDESTRVAAGGEGEAFSHDIHAKVLPYFAKWRRTYGNVFVYWLGTEPFLYVADPQFLKQATSGVPSDAWGKPDVFRRDREALFGSGILTVDGDAWYHRRTAANPAFSTSNLNAMLTTMVDCATKLVDGWAHSVTSGRHEIDIDIALNTTAAEIMARTSLGIDEQDWTKLHEKLSSMHALLFKSNRPVGVPFSNLLHMKRSRDIAVLGREIDGLILDIIRRRTPGRHDLLGKLMAEKKLAEKDLVDECKTFFFAGHETTALAVSWTLLLLAAHPEWQLRLREEIEEVCGGEPLDAEKLNKLIKMEWVFNEALRLYSTAPNVQRQARQDIEVGGMLIPKGTNMWIDTLGMNHDAAWWGEDVHEFRPERFEHDHKGGCNPSGAFSPFGRGKRLCIGRNLSRMEYKVLLSLLLRNFSFSPSPKYRHDPRIELTLRPSHGIPMIVRRREDGGY